MLDAGVIESVKESEWIIPIVVQDKNTSGEVRICVDLRKLNDACLHDPFSTPFWLVYGKEVVMPMEYIVPSLIIVAISEMKDDDVIEYMLLQLVQLEEERFVAGFHQNVEKRRQKVWHYRHIENK